MKNDRLQSIASDALGLSLALGSAIVFLGYFWPELIGWVRLASVVGPTARTILPVLVVVGAVTGGGLLKKADWARQIASIASPLAALGFLAIASLQILYADSLAPASLTARCTACAVAVVYFGLLGGLLACGGKKEDDTATDSLTPPTTPVKPEDEEKPDAKPRPVRSPVFAAALSIVAGILAIAAAVCIAYDPKGGLRLAPAVPSLMLMNVVGAGLAWGGFAQAEDGSRARSIGIVGAILNLLPVIGIVLVVALRRVT
ncbi:MAG: hypothetical protein AB1696_10985 [Planctomycetota bacterium]